MAVDIGTRTRKSLISAHSERGIGGSGPT